MLNPEPRNWTSSHLSFQRSFRAVCAACLIALVAAVTPGCKRDEVTHVQTSSAPQAANAAPTGPPMAAPGQPASGAPMMPPVQAPPGLAGDVPPPPRPAKALQWALPKGWKEELIGGMRYATLTPPVKGRIDVSVVVLPGPAGGELANVNRWRSQLGLPPIDEAQLSSARRSVQSKAGPLSLYDFTGEGEKKSRMMAGLAIFEGSSWFFKMVGDADAVAAAQKDFVTLLESLHFEAH